MAMAPQFSRIDTLALKSEIEKKLGGKATEYFVHLSKFLTHKITESDFHRRCIRMIGKENVHLHNRLIRSIMQNAMLSETPQLKEKKVEGALSVRKPNRKGSNGSSLCRLLPPCPRKERTPCKFSRSARYQPYPLGPIAKSFGRSVGYCPSPLGPNGKSSNVAVKDARLENQEKQIPMELYCPGSRPPTSEENQVFDQACPSPVSPNGKSLNVAVKDVSSENQEKESPMELDSSGFRPPSFEVDGVFDQAHPSALSPNMRSSNVAIKDMSSRNQDRESPMELDPLGSRPPGSEVDEVFDQAHPSSLSPNGKSSNLPVKDASYKNQEKESPIELVSSGSGTPASEVDEEFGQPAISRFVRSRSPIRAPLGVYVHSKDGQGVSYNSLASSNRISMCRNTNGLPDTITLKKCLELKLEKEGLKLTTDCADLINKSLELHLKRLIKPCLDQAQSCSGQEQLSQGHFQGVASNMQTVRQIQQPSGSVVASISDFGVAMELNPTILGHQWPVQLEKIAFLESQNRLENDCGRDVRLR